jgi:hypothetical protein
MSNIDTIRAELDQARAAARKAAEYDRVVNEGGQGYETSEAHVDRILEISKRLFAAEWTREIFDARRAIWNTRVSKLGAKITMQQVYALEAELGFTQTQLMSAKALHGVK